MKKRLERLRLIVCGSLSGAVVLFWMVLALLALVGLVLAVPAFVGETGLRWLLLGALAVGGALGGIAMLRYGPRLIADDDLPGACQAIHLCYHPVVPREQLGTLLARPPFDRLWKGPGPGRHFVEGRTGDVEFLLVDCPRRTGYQTVAIFRGPNGALPNFRLRPRTAWDRMLGIEGVAFDEGGLSDHDHRAVARFANHYVLEAAEADEPEVRRVFTVDVLAFFAQRPGWSVQAHQGILVVWQRLVATAATAELYLDEQLVRLSRHGAAARRLDLLGTAQQIRRLATRAGPSGRVLPAIDGQGVRLQPVLTAVFHGAFVGAWTGVCVGFFLEFTAGVGRGVQGASRGLLIGAAVGGGLCAVLAVAVHALKARRSGAKSRESVGALPPL